MSNAATTFSQSFFHRTKADLKIGDLIAVGYRSNFADFKPLSWTYFTSTMDTAIWGAELASGDARERIYVVEATGEVVDDPNLTDKKFPGNPSMSYRSQEPLKVIAEVIDWEGHSADQVKAMKDGLARMQAGGTGHIID